MSFVKCSSHFSQHTKMSIKKYMNTMSTVLAQDFFWKCHCTTRHVNQCLSSCLTNIWQVYGNVSFSNADLMATVKSMAHIVISWDPPLSSACILQALTCCKNVQALSVQVAKCKKLFKPIIPEQFPDTSPQQRFKEVSAVPYLKKFTFSCEKYF